MEDPMESNKWLWQPRKYGPIHLRLTYSDADGKRQQFTHSLFSSRNAAFRLAWHRMATDTTRASGTA